MCVCILSLCKLMDCNPLGSSVHGIFQARIVEWVAISSSRWCSWPRDQTYVSCNGRQIVSHCVTWEALIEYIARGKESFDGFNCLINIFSLISTCSWGYFILPWFLSCILFILLVNLCDFGLEHVDFKLPVGLQEEVSGRQPALCIWGWRGLPGWRASPLCQSASLCCWGAVEQAWGRLLICPTGTASPAFESRIERDTQAMLSTAPAWRGMAACS